MGNSSLRVIFSVQVLWCSLISYLYSAMMCLHLALDLALKLSRSVLPSFFIFFFHFSVSLSPSSVAFLLAFVFSFCTLCPYHTALFLTLMVLLVVSMLVPDSNTKVTCQKKKWTPFYITQHWSSRLRRQLIYCNEIC